MSENFIGNVKCVLRMIEIIMNESKRRVEEYFALRLGKRLEKRDTNDFLKRLETENWAKEERRTLNRRTKERSLKVGVCVCVCGLLIELWIRQQIIESELM